MMRIWFKADDTFLLPKSCIYLHLSRFVLNYKPVIRLHYWD